MFRLFFTSILLRLLRIPIVRIDEKRIRIFLWTIYPQQGFNDYITKCDMAILQRIGMGVQRDEYLDLLGERIRVGLFLSDAKRAFERVEKDRKERIEAIKKVSDKRKIIQEEKPKPKENL